MAKAKIPDAMETPRWTADRYVEVAGEIPLIEAGAPAHKQVRKRLMARCRVFDLLIKEDAQDYEAIWQKIADKEAVFCEKTEPVFKDGKLLAFLRWGEWDYVAPRA